MYIRQLGLSALGRKSWQTLGQSAFRLKWTGAPIYVRKCLPPVLASLSRQHSLKEGGIDEDLTLHEVSQGAIVV
jgi:hypothetical protein